MSKPISLWITALFQKSDYGKEISYMAEIRADLELLVNLLRNNNERVLVIIDDLDRCNPRKAVEVLQAINLLLNFDSFIVCLGIDARIITCAIEEYYKNLLGSAGASGYEYLDKIIQIPFRIPHPSPEQIKLFLGNYLRLEIKEDQNSEKITIRKRFSQIIPFLKNRLLLTIEQIVRFIDILTRKEIELEVGVDNGDEKVNFKVSAKKQEELIEQIQHVFKAISKFATSTNAAFTTEEIEAFQFFSYFLHPNPRHLKRLVNVYRLVRTLAEYESDDLILKNPVVTIHWLIMCGQWPYTANIMLQYFDDILQQQREGLLDLPQVNNPLIYLLEQVSSQILKDKQINFDHDPDLLVKFLNAQKTRLEWEELSKIRQYTINFNPAIEALI